MQLSDSDLYCRGIATVLACWEENARAARDATVARLPGVASAVFPTGPERRVYNNAIIERDLSAHARARAVEAMESMYRSAGIANYAAWVHESDEGLRSELSGRGYVMVETNRAMGMALDDLHVEQPVLELAPPDWPEYLRVLGEPDLLSGADPTAYHVLIARHAGANASTAMAFDHAGDCGIFNVTTLETARRHGLATAITAEHLRLAIDRGCETATLQSTEMAEGVYERLGFRDLGRILEFVPGD